MKACRIDVNDPHKTEGTLSTLRLLPLANVDLKKGGQRSLTSTQLLQTEIKKK